MYEVKSKKSTTQHFCRLVIKKILFLDQIKEPELKSDIFELIITRLQLISRVSFEFF